MINGKSRWPVRAATSITETPGGENTAFQEFSTEIAAPMK